MDSILEKKFITTKDAGELFGYTSDYLARLARSGKIVGKKIGHSWLIDTESLTRFLGEQGDRKIDYARALARTREAEYHAHHSLLNRATEALTKTLPAMSKVESPISQSGIAKSPLRSNIFALSVAVLTIVSAALVAQTTIIPQLAEKTGSLALEISSGLHTTFGDIPSHIVTARSDLLASVPLRPRSSARIASPLFTEFDFSFARIPSFFENALTHSSVAFTSTAVAIATTPIFTVEDLCSSASSIYTFFTTPSFPDFINRVNLAFGTTIINATHFAIRADVAFAYSFGNVAPESARAVTALLANTTAARYIALISATGNLAYEGTAGTLALAHAASSLLSRAPAALEDAYLGMLGKSALALDSFGARIVSMGHTPVLAAVLPALSASEQAALFTYQTIHGFFDSATRALAALFGTSSNIAVVSNPPSTILPFATSTIPVSAPRPIPPSVSPARAPRIAVTNYPIYTTVVKGVSEDFMNQSLASLRTGILATVAGMVQPVAAQTVTNATTIQQVNMIQDLSNLIVRNGDFRGGTFDKGSVTNGISVSATTGNFTNLTGGATSLATTTVTGSLTTTGSLGVGTTSPSDTFALNGSAYFAQVSSPLVTTNRLYNTGGSLYFNGTALGAGGGGTSSWATTTSQVSGWLINYPTNATDIVTIGSSSTTTAPFFFDPNTTIGYISGKLGIGTTSPYAKLSVVGEIVGSYFTATSTTATSTFANHISIGSGKSYRINGVPVMKLATSSSGDSFFAGQNAGASNTTGYLNTFVGLLAGYSNTSGAHNVFVGNSAGYFNQSGTSNTFIGDSAGYFNQSGSVNTFIGVSAGYNNTGSANIFIGQSAGGSNTAGNSNLFLGNQSGGSNTTGSDNIFLGGGGGANNTGTENIAIGNASFATATSSTYNIAIGSYALNKTTWGNNNIAMGKSALYSNTVGSGNVTMGTQAGYFKKSGDSNVLIGDNAGFGVTNKSYNNNTYVGALAGYGNETGSNNSFLGYYAGSSNTTGSNNIFLGFQAGDSNTTGSNNIVIGYDIDATSTTATGSLNIGNLIFGTGIDGTSTTLSSGNVGIGTTSPYAKLSVEGSSALGNSALAGYFIATSTTATSTFSGGVSIGGNNGLNVLSNGQAMIGSNTTPGSGAALTIRNTAGLNQTLLIDSNGADYQMTLSDSYTNATSKDTAILMAHYLNSSEESIPLVSGRALTSSNILFIGGNDVQTGQYNAATELRFLTGATNTTLNGTTRMFIDSSGNVGIGTTSPWRTLSVTGTMAITEPTLSSTGDYLCWDTVTKEVTAGTATCTLSSERFKTGIEPLSASSGLAEVLALNPVQFYYKQGYGDNGAKLQLGFIAEQAAPIDSRLVTLDEQGIPNGFMYQTYTAVLTKAIQELSVKFDAEAMRVTSLEERVAALESGAVSSASGSPVSFSTSSIASALESVSGALHIGKLIADTFYAAQGFIDHLTAANVTVGTAAAPTGVTLYDTVTKQPYCFGMSDGVATTTPGACAPTNANLNPFVTSTITSVPQSSGTGGPASAIDSVIIGNSNGTVSVSGTSSTTGSTTTSTSTPPASDTTAPVVTLIGDAALQIDEGQTFTDPGATAMDDIGGDLTANIVVTGAVDTTTPGLYTLTYSATDAAGNTGSVSRVVTVVASTAATTPTSATQS